MLTMCVLIFITRTFFFFFNLVTASKQQHFRVSPKDVNAREGTNVTLNCEIDDITGDVQWTKDGLALGKYSYNIIGVLCECLFIIFRRLTDCSHFRIIKWEIFGRSTCVSAYQYYSPRWKTVKRSEKKIYIYTIL